MSIMLRTALIVILLTPQRQGKHEQLDNHRKQKNRDPPIPRQIVTGLHNEPEQAGKSI